MKYYILMYKASVNYPDIWDSISSESYFYPNELLGYSVGNNGQQTPIWGDGVVYLICKDSEPTQQMTDITLQEAAAWNLQNQDNQTGAMQLVFEESERFEIAAQLQARIDELTA